MSQCEECGTLMEEFDSANCCVCGKPLCLNCEITEGGDAYCKKCHEEEV